MDFRCLIDNDLNFRDCIFDNLRIGIGKVSKVTGTKFDFSNKSISFSRCSFLNNFKIEGEKDSNTFKSLSLDDCNIGSSSSFNIRNFELNEFRLSNLNNNSFNSLIQSIKVTKKLILNDTSFNKTEFIDFIADSKDLNIEFKDISFYGAKLSNFHCKKLKDLESERKYSQQLKKVFDEQKDYITANEYYVREMNAYQLGKEKNVLNWISNKLIFWINKKVSNYSQSWILPIIWMFFLGLYFNLECQTNFSHLAFLITFISGLFLDYLYERKNYNLKIAFIFIVPFSYLIVFFLVSKGFHFTSIIDLLNSVIHIKINFDASLKEKIHTIIFGFLIYHLTITVKRKLKR